MNRYHIALLMAVVVLVGVAVVPVALADDDEPSDAAPGERLMGSIGAQEAELGNEVDERAFGEAIAAAASEGNTSALADLIEDRADRNEQRLADLKERLSGLEQQLEDGEITRGQFNAEVTKLEVERQSIVRTTAETADAANGLPTELIEERGINVTAIELLQQEASELGPEINEIAQSIAGPNVGHAAPDRPTASDRLVNQVLHFDDVNQSIERTAHWIDHTDRTIDRITDRAERFNDSQAGPPFEVTDEVWANLENASTELELAKAALEAANDELAAGNESAAWEHVEEAATHTAAASTYANTAAAELRGPLGPGFDRGPPGNGPP